MLDLTKYMFIEKRIAQLSVEHQTRQTHRYSSLRSATTNAIPRHLFDKILAYSLNYHIAIPLGAA